MSAIEFDPSSVPTFSPLVEDRSTPGDAEELALKKVRLLTILQGVESEDNKHREERKRAVEAAYSTLKPHQTKSKSRQRLEMGDAATNLLLEDSTRLLSAEVTDDQPRIEVLKWQCQSSGDDAVDGSDEYAWSKKAPKFFKPNASYDRALASRFSMDIGSRIQQAMESVSQHNRCVFSWRNLAEILEGNHVPLKQSSTRCGTKTNPTFEAEVRHIMTQIVPVLQIRDRPCNARDNLLRQAHDRGDFLEALRPAEVNQAFWGIDEDGNTVPQEKSGDDDAQATQKTARDEELKILMEKRALFCRRYFLHSSFASFGPKYKERYEKKECDGEGDAGVKTVTECTKPESK